MLARTDNDLDRIRNLIAEICRVTVADDGLEFDADTLRTERIAQDALYEGVRAVFSGRLGKAKVPMQIDLGFSDIITPAPASISYPSLLDMPKADLIAYNRETAIAEKFEAMVKLGELNSRMKDFFDIWTLSQSQHFDSGALRAAIVQTFTNRNTDRDLSAICLSSDFATLPAKQAQWKAFLRRSNLADRAPQHFRDACSSVMAFLKPMMDESDDQQTWQPGGPWQS